VEKIEKIKKTEKVVKKVIRVKEKGISKIPNAFRIVVYEEGSEKSPQV
jgi:hypothetical protein